MIKKEIMTAIKLSFLTLFLTGFIYPVLVTGIASFLFLKGSQGSLIYDDQQNIIGSELIGQNFKKASYFFPRPSAAGNGYDGIASGGSNLGPTSKALVKRVQERVEEIKKDNSEFIPVDLLTTSGSGLDPHITPQAAKWQALRVANQRGVSLRRILTLIDDLTEPPQLYVLGEPRVNVLKLNLSLDQFFDFSAVSP